jgi:hypothetical protein
LLIELHYSTAKKILSLCKMSQVACDNMSQE